MSFDSNKILYDIEIFHFSRYLFLLYFIKVSVCNRLQIKEADPLSQMIWEGLSEIHCEDGGKESRMMSVM